MTMARGASARPRAMVTGYSPPRSSRPWRSVRAPRPGTGLHPRVERRDSPPRAARHYVRQVDRWKDNPMAAVGL